MSYNTDLQQNNANLLAILNKVNSLPNTGGETPAEPVLQEKTVTPTKSQQIVTPDGDYDGLSQVTIEAIPDQYIVPSGELEVTKNGIFDVTEKAVVVVSVPDREVVLQDIEVTENGTYSADDGYDGIGQVIVNVPTEDLSELLTEQENMIAELQDILRDKSAGDGSSDAEIPWLTREVTEYSNPTLTKLGAYALSGTQIVSLNLPELTMIEGYAFYNCAKLESMVFQKLAEVSINGCREWTGLVKADFHVLTYIRSNGFYKAANLDTLIVRTPSLCGLASGTVWTGTKIASGNGYIYVPASLVDTYKAATNWSVFADQIRAIEDYPEITGGEA